MVVVMMVVMLFVMINAGDQSPLCRFRGITFDYPKGFLKSSYPLAVVIAHDMLNRLYVRPLPRRRPSFKSREETRSARQVVDRTGDKRSQVASRG
ncbi:hypothetical protein DPMN_070413 [Dreissena polymorpha]|uniref:Secreted protein n=1 Tax=Dreissena polymorpha TaxID=45954 RepID=A0A9D4BV34_DREPO|nr:hypothetical protein DPMN_070413 [Dreissena polymorpha]